MRMRSLQKNGVHVFSNIPDKNCLYFSVIQNYCIKKKLQYTSKVFIYLKSTIPCVPLRSLLFQVLLVFILVACYFLISGPACSCCSSPYRWNKQESLSHSQEYSWSADWQWWGSSRSLRASGSSDSSMGAGRGSSVVSKLLRLHRKFLPAEPCWVQA